MSKRTQLWLALSSLGLVIVLLVILFLSIILRSDEEALPLVDSVQPTAWRPEDGVRQTEPWANLEDRALQMVWGRTVRSVRGDNGRPTIRQVVETDLLQRSFPNLHWSRLERIGWRSFQQEGSVYEVQFVLQDVGVEFGPSWIVQTDPGGLQPPGSGGVVAANVFAEVVEHGMSRELGRYLGREEEVVQALTNHRFEGGARLASAILVFFKSRRNVSEEQLIGWTVVGERIVPNELTLYRAFFQWREGDNTYFAHWEVNLDTSQFRGLNLLASEIMATGDTVTAGELEDIRPRMLAEITPSQRQRRAFRALLTIVENERLIEAVASLLWHQSRYGAQIEYSRWNAQPVPDSDGVYDVGYEYLENEDPQLVSWRVDVERSTVEPLDGLARMAHVALTYSVTDQSNGNR